MEFSELAQQAAGHKPYEYQERLASQGLPDVLAVPTGAGKTLSATLPWLYRRLYHPDPAVQKETPRRLVFTLPMRVLVEQTFEKIEAWLTELGLTGDVGLYRVMGGEERGEPEWRKLPDQDAIFVGTLDMLLSRALNRGYGESRWIWPIDFGLFNSGTQWVFDEVQLMGPALETSRQLDAFRRSFGTALPCRSTWMSATVDGKRLETVDNPTPGHVVELSDQDRNGPLRQRLQAPKTVRRLEISQKSNEYARDLAAAVQQEHRSGSRTLVVVNTVERATQIYQALKNHLKGPGIELALLHSRFRPPERQAAVGAALAEVESGSEGRIVVSTQVLEAGVDTTSDTLLTELAPWPSIVQRAGRCNREGEAEEAVLYWVSPPNAAPYEDGELEAASEILGGLEGESASPEKLESIHLQANDPIHPVLRRRDLLELFDTLPDLSGNDIDVSRFIRSTDDIDVQIAWRDLRTEGKGAVGPPDPKTSLPSRDERCPVPLGLLKKDKRFNERRIYRYDHIGEAWVRCFAGDLRPGQVLIMEATDGGYDPVLGWSPLSRTPVPPVDAGKESPSAADNDTAVGSDPVSYARQWVSLSRHLTDVDKKVDILAKALDPDVEQDLLDAAVVAGRYHDLGKAHEVFQRTLWKSTQNDDEQRAAAEREPRPWAKSGSKQRPRHERSHFRHELASALALLDDSVKVLDQVRERDQDLVLYLIAAHHGRVRLGFRSLPDEKRPGDDPDRLFALGVWQGDELPPVDVGPDEVVPASRLDLSTMLLGRAGDGSLSWAERALTLRDRPDLGPFRLAFLEALVRMADWRVSAGYDRLEEEPADG